MVIYFVLLADSFTFSKSYFSQTTTNLRSVLMYQIVLFFVCETGSAHISSF